MLVQYTCVPSGEQVLNTTPIMDHVTSTSTVTFYAFYAYGAFLHTEDIIYYIYAYMPCMYVMVNNHLGLRWLLTSPILLVCCSAICSDIASKFPYSPPSLHCVNEWRTCHNNECALYGMLNFMSKFSGMVFVVCSQYNALCEDLCEERSGHVRYFKWRCELA